MSPPASAFTTGSCSFSGLLKVTAASRARPIMHRQSGRLGVISNSTTWSSMPSSARMSSPGLQSSCRIRMPSVMQLGNSSGLARRSSGVRMRFLAVS